MKLIKLAEFQDLLDLSDSAMVCLLRENKLKFSLSQDQGLMIDIEEVQINQLVQAIITLRAELLNQNSELIAEKMAALVGKNLERLIEEALASTVA